MLIRCQKNFSDDSYNEDSDEGNSDEEFKTPDTFLFSRF